VTEPTSALARYTVDLDLASLPQPVVRQARVVLADTLALMLAGSAERVVETALDALPLEAGPCTVVGHGKGAPAEIAAFINSLSATALDLDDTHSPSLTHPASVIVPAVLAASECAGNVSGAKVLAAIVAAYDVQVRLSRALGPQAQFDRGFHPASITGSVGAAVGAGRILSLSAEQMRRCIGLAASQSAGVLTFRGDATNMHKGFQVGAASRSGVFSALLAQHGFLAAADVLGGRFNMLAAFGGHAAHPDELVADLGSRYEILGTSIKRHPSCGRSHAPIDALLMLRSENRIVPDDIRTITVEVAHSAVVTIDMRPQLTHNIQFLMATVAIDGTLERRHFVSAWSDRPDVHALMEKVVVIGNDALEAMFPDDKGATVTVETSAGTYRRGLDGPRGSPDQPLNERELQQKFLSLATERLDSGRARSLWDVLQGAEAVTSTGRLIADLGA
jgi:2-methylcitrate dehydratase PrpD